MLRLARCSKNDRKFKDVSVMPLEFLDFFSAHPTNLYKILNNVKSRPKNKLHACKQARLVTPWSS